MVIDNTCVYHFVNPGLRVDIIFENERTAENGVLALKWKSRKGRWENGVICLVFMLPSWVMFLKYPKKCIFCNFALTAVRNLRLLKQFTYMDLKILITVFQKMIWFIEVWATVHEILAIKISKTMLTQQKFNKVLRFQTLISSKH